MQSHLNKSTAFYSVLQNTQLVHTQNINQRNGQAEQNTLLALPVCEP